MAIQVTCSNGHVLNVRDEMAGKAGLCPACRVTVRVPARKETFEDSICDMLNAPGGGAWVPDATDAPYDAARRLEKKICHKCRREIAAGNHICPYCHTYIAKLTDF